MNPKNNTKKKSPKEVTSERLRKVGNEMEKLVVVEDVIDFVEKRRRRGEGVEREEAGAR